VTDFAETVALSPANFFIRVSDGGCVATDHRSWSDAADASARVTSDFHLLIDGSGRPSVRPAGESLTSTASVRSIDCVTGTQVAATPTQLLAESVSSPSETPRGVQVSVLAAIPDLQRAWSSSTIHYDATFTFDQRTHLLEYQASLGVFPAYEAYARLNDGPVVTVFRSAPVRRNEVVQQAGKAEPTSVTLTGSVNLNELKRPKAPTGLTVQ
jgi:hypothetical protein